MFFGNTVEKVIYLRVEFNLGKVQFNFHLSIVKSNKYLYYNYIFNIEYFIQLNGKYVFALWGESCSSQWRKRYML